MRVIRNLNNIEKNLQNSCLTLGNFDGLHLGHQKILNFNKKLAQENQQKTALLTFEPHPRHFFVPKSKRNSRIYSLAQKLAILRAEKLVDIVFLMNFNQILANLEAQNFIEDILVKKLKVSNLTVGYDCNFGKNRLGNADLLKNLSQKYNYNFYQIAADKDNLKEIYSSTRVRNLLKINQIKDVNNILGRNYDIRGLVIKGNQQGRKIGFKTANIKPKFNIIQPNFGVYKTITKISGKKYNSISNFGIKPTFNNQSAFLETHIFDFKQDIYNQKITVELLDFIRPEMKFNDISQLKSQISKDIQKCQDIKLP